MNNVKVTYKVGGESFGCNKLAGEVKEAGKKISYVVGDKETPCEQTAEMWKAQAVVRTIIETAGALFAS